MSKAKVDTRPVPKLSDIENFFSQYKEDQDGEGEVIGPNGIMKLCGDLKIDPADVSLLLLMWHCKATKLYYLSKDEFFHGCTKFKVSNAEDLADMLTKFKQSLSKFPPSKFEEFYIEDKNKKYLDLDDAVFMLDLLLNGKPHIVGMVKFLKESWKKPVGKDQWRMILEFSNTVKTDFSNYDENQSWPGLLDDFVAWSQENK